MKIVSKFRDYYDHVAGPNVDDGLVYKRMTRREKGAELYELVKAATDAPYWYDRGGCLSALVFCGKARLFVRFQETLYLTWESYAAAANTALEAAKDPNQIAWLRNLVESMQLTGGYGGGFYRGFNTEGTWQRIEARLNAADFTPFHRTYQSPLLLLQDWDTTPDIKHSKDWLTEREKYRGHLIVNPCLRDIGFHKVVDAFTTYQEIDMFLRNVLTVRERSDRLRTSEEIRDSHGFNAASFVGQHPNKKQRRKANKKRKKKQ